MAKLKEILTRQAPWSELVMGNYALARGMIDSGTRVITTFPGSPTPEIAAAIDLVDKKDRTYYFEYSTNEKVAVEIAAGASLNGHASAVFFKSVGLNVAADSLIQLSMMNLIGGMVIILGDDPGANSSQNEQDNRWFSRMSYIPMLEPATPQEAYDMYHEALRLSKEDQIPVILRLTTHVCHAREVVTVKGMSTEEPDWTSRYDPKNGPYMPIGSTVFPLKRMALGKRDKFSKIGDKSTLNKIISPNGSALINGKRLGIISAALPAGAVHEELASSDASVDLLKIGLTYPLPATKILIFLNEHDEVLILEELDRVMESEIKSMAFDNDVTTKIYARTNNEDLMGEWGPSRVLNLLQRTWPDIFHAKPTPEPSKASVSTRVPQMCPGCGHRSAFYAVKKALDPKDITVADIGCHSLGFMKPLSMGTVLFSMGHGVSTASGLSIENPDRKVVTFIGDSTLIHAGIPGIINAATYDHNITLILLDNGTTAMTGHQPRFGTEEVGDSISFNDLLVTLGVKFLRDVDAYNQAKLTEYVKEANEHKGFAMIIARHPCMLQFTRKQRQQMPGFKLPPIKLDQSKCKNIYACIGDFACPSFQRADDGSIYVNEDLCIGDGSCLQTCPVNALERQKPRGAK